MYIENIVIGKPLLHPKELLAVDDNDWVNIEKEKTLFTEERCLHKILVMIGIFPSVSEIRRNKPELIRQLNSIDFFDGMRITKKRKLWIIVGG